ncbi:hypothetical protein EJ02DRAFT_428858 [Clathrospora elynae]|uniref:Uncharacterized protein n=1 Tax=Clathrospora elynae TaxID=706981 RepID=A0A6A5S2R0_9PLEO|nr:hypothetical protein EJ02DRAFT_428858 [Clathrospora elynae]
MDTSFLSPLKMTRADHKGVIATGIQVKLENNGLDSHPNRDYLDLTRFRRQFRTEFYSFFMDRVGISIDLTNIGDYAECFHQVFKTGTGMLVIIFDPLDFSLIPLNPPRKQACVDLLPLLRLDHNALRLRVSFVAVCAPRPVALRLSVALDLSWVNDLSRETKVWAGNLHEAMACTGTNSSRVSRSSSRSGADWHG